MFRTVLDCRSCSRGLVLQSSSQALMESKQTFRNPRALTCHPQDVPIIERWTGVELSPEGEEICFRPVEYEVKFVEVDVRGKQRDNVSMTPLTGELLKDVGFSLKRFTVCTINLLFDRKAPVTVLA